MDTIYMRRVAVSLMAAMLGFAACSEGRPNTPEAAKSRIEADMLAVESQGAMGEVFAALRESEPEIYEKIVAAASKAVDDGTLAIRSGGDGAPTLHRAVRRTDEDSGGRGHQ